jgi:hypothetical protein
MHSLAVIVTLSAMNEEWEKLKVGDRIRIVRMPSGVDTFHRDTRKLYKRLIARGYAQRINKICEWGLPWIKCRFLLPDGRWEYHSLAVNDDSWVLVNNRS